MGERTMPFRFPITVEDRNEMTVVVINNSAELRTVVRRCLGLSPGYMKMSSDGDLASDLRENGYFVRKGS